MIKKEIHSNDYTLNIFKQIEDIIINKYNKSIKKEPDIIQENLMYIPESTAGDTINMVAIKAHKKEEKSDVDVITPIKLNIDNETKNKVMQIASQYLGSILELNMINENISKVQEYIKKEQLEAVEIKTAHTFTAENDWIRATFCEDNVGIEFKK